MELKISKKGVLALILAGVACCSAIVAFYACNSKALGQLPEGAQRIAILDGLVLKQKAQCFKLHEENAKKMSAILQDLRQAEIRIKTQFGAIRNNKKKTEKQKKREIEAIEAKWQAISKKYNEQIQSVKDLDYKLALHINASLTSIVQKTAKQMRIDVVLNKQTVDNLFIFYNTAALDITDYIARELDSRLANLAIGDIQNATK